MHVKELCFKLVLFHQPHLVKNKIIPIMARKKIIKEKKLFIIKKALAPLKLHIFLLGVVSIMIYDSFSSKNVREGDLD